MERQLLFYDVEVFAYDHLIVIKDINKKEVMKAWNKVWEEQEIIDLLDQAILVGYNNYHYDDYILTEMFKDPDPKHIKNTNDDIIFHGQKFQRNEKLISLDCFQQIDVSNPGLKKIEANMGMSIEETQVSFDINRPLTAKERELTEFYCAYDVDATIEVYKLRKEGYFDSKMALLNRLPEPSRDRALRWNVTTISAHLINGGEASPKWSNIRLDRERWKDIEQRLSLVPKEVSDMWKDNVEHVYQSEKPKKKVIIYEFGCKIEFGLGGLHGVNADGQKRFNNVKLLDVASLYPNIIIFLQALGEEGTKKYLDVVKERLRIKHDKDKQDLQSALKLVINGCFGLMNNQYSSLYNPNGALSVCIFGQLCLYDLCKRLSDSCRIININTDGVAFTTDSDEYLEVWEEWESDYGFTLEEENYNLFIQKDVNNYIAVTKEGKIKVKGGDVGRYHEDAPFKNNSLRIVDKAIVDYLVHGIPVSHTRRKYKDNPKYFQMVLQAGPTFKGTVDQNGNMMGKINRVFATHKGDFCLFKWRADGASVLFPDVPERMLLYNGDLGELQDFNNELDHGFYDELIQRKLERWE